MGITRSLTRPVASQIARRLTDVRLPRGEGAPAVIDPLQAILSTHFTGPELAAIILPMPVANGAHRLWRDLERTVPAVADGDPIRVADDIRGNGLRMIAPTSAARPVLRNINGRWSIEGNGTNSSMSMSGVNLSGVSRLFICAAVRKVGGNFMQLLGQGSTGAGDSGSWDMAAGGGAGSNRNDYTIRFASPIRFNESAEVFPSPSTDVITGRYDRTMSGAAQLLLRANGAATEGSFSAGAVSSGNMNAPLDFLSRQGSAVFFSGHSYGFFLREGAIADASLIEQYLSDLSGRALDA